MLTDYRDTVKLSPDYDLPLPVIVSKLVGYLFETKRIAVSTVLDLLALFASLTTICLMPYLERYPTETNIKQNIVLQARAHRQPARLLAEVSSA